jgi:hypothetical protein
MKKPSEAVHFLFLCTQCHPDVAAAVVPGSAELVQLGEQAV